MKNFYNFFFEKRSEENSDLNSGKKDYSSESFQNDFSYNPYGNNSYNGKTYSWESSKDSYKLNFGWKSCDLEKGISQNGLKDKKYDWEWDYWYDGLGYNYFRNKNEPKIPKAKIKETRRVFSIALLDYKWFENDLVSRCNEKAGISEFQFNFNCLEIQFNLNKIKVYVVLPLSMYNYPQEVTGGSVDFNLKDVNAIADRVKEKDMALANSLVSILSSNPLFNNLLKLSKVKYIKDGMSIHRHPGRFGFSGTDLNNNPKSPGIVYRKSEGKGFVQLDGIMVFDPNFDVYCLESRYLAIKKYKDGVKGAFFKNSILTVLRNPPINKFEKELGIDYKLIGDSSLLVSNIIYPIVQVLKSLNYDLITDIDPNHIKQKSYSLFDNNLPALRTDISEYGKIIGPGIGVNLKDDKDKRKWVKIKKTKFKINSKLKNNNKSRSKKLKWDLL